MIERNGLQVFTLDEVLDEQLGPLGTPLRDAHEQAVAEAVVEDDKKERTHSLGRVALF